jgi:uncharacterized membrane protein
MSAYQTFHVTGRDDPPRISRFREDDLAASAAEQVMSGKKSLGMRTLHALGYELIALLICAPVLAWLFDESAAHAGMLTLMLSLLAMVWNIFFNAMFERVAARLRKLGGLAKRVVHALLFEAGLILVAVPTVAWWLGVSMIDALLLDLGFLLFFLPYTFAYNWAFDRLLQWKSATAT